MPHLDAWAAERAMLAEGYREAFESIEGISMLAVRPGRHVYHQLVVMTEHRDELRVTLKEQGIGTAIYYPEPLHLQPCFANAGYVEGSLPVCEAAAKQSLALPCFVGMTRAEQDEVVGAITRYFNTV